MARAALIATITIAAEISKTAAPAPERERPALNRSMLVGRRVYGYATGVFSSRKLERGTYASVAFRPIAANAHPDRDTIATIRQRFLKETEGAVCRSPAAGARDRRIEDGTVGLDKTKTHANASRHSALSYEYAGRIEPELKAEVTHLLARAAADQADLPVGMSIPADVGPTTRSA